MNEIPVNRGDILDLNCESVGTKGDGICRYENFVVIVPGMEIGTSHRVKITKVLNNLSFGELYYD